MEHAIRPLLSETPLSKVGLTSQATSEVRVNKENGDNEQKKTHNNNNAADGRLKFYKDGRCLLELAHRRNGDRGQVWVPITKKVYWPPTAPGNNEVVTKAHVQHEGASSGQSVSDSASTADISSVSSPWPPSLPSVLTPSLPHRSKGKPSRYPINKPDPFLHFVMKPPPCIVSIRKRTRHLKRKRRRPAEAVTVAALILKAEMQAVKIRPKRRKEDIDRIKKSSRLESCVSKVQTLPPKKKNHLPLVPIQSWQQSNRGRVGVATSKSSSKPPAPAQLSNVISSGGVVKVKSELFQVTETCTAATLTATMASTSGVRTPSSQKVKAETRHVMETKSPLSHSLMSNAKTLPITPTMARIKSDKPPSPNILSSIIISSPDQERVKMEFSKSRESHFQSPRKRFLKNFDNGSPAAKKHRLSTDSSAGSSENGGTNSPHLRTNSPLLRTNSPLLRVGPGSPFSQPHHLSHHAPSPPRPIVSRSSSFSIDSIISRDERDAKPIRPMPLPASPARPPPESVMDYRPRVSSPPHVPISPYMTTPRSSGHVDLSRIDPRLAHLAGVAANPNLGLSPAFSVMNNPYYAAALTTQMSQLAAAGLWSPSPAMTTHRQMRSPSPAAPNTTMSSMQHSSPVISRSGTGLLGSSWLPQYRGEPKVDAGKNEASSEDTPLDLCTKR